VQIVGFGDLTGDRTFQDGLHYLHLELAAETAVGSWHDFPPNRVGKPFFLCQARGALQGAHFKSISFDLLDQDAISFAGHVVQLVEALSHPDHGWPTNDNSGSYWRNNGDSRRLHPRKKPS
jgi:hypothetical protein